MKPVEAAGWQALLDAEKTDPAVGAAVEIALPAGGVLAEVGPFRRILLLTREGKDYRRTIEFDRNQGWLELFWIPELGVVCRRASEEAQQSALELQRVHFDRTNGKILDRLQHFDQGKPVSRRPYSLDVKYLAYRKIMRIAEDARKNAQKGRKANARLLTWMTLSHLTRYQFIRRDLPLPSRLQIAEGLNREDSDTATLAERLLHEKDIEACLDPLFDSLQREQEAYPGSLWNWESKPIRFGRGFDFAALLMAESPHWLWRLRDRLLPAPQPVMPKLIALKDRNLRTLGRLKTELGDVAKSLAGITGALVMGSGAHREGRLEDLAGSDLDVVFFTRGLYLKRFFYQIGGVLMDGIVLPTKVARIGLERRAAICVSGLSEGEILYDCGGALKSLQAESREVFRGSPASLSPEEIRFALAGLQSSFDRFSVAATRGSRGAAFLIVDRLLDVLYLALSGLGFWAVGEQRMVPFLEERFPRVAEALKGALAGNGISSFGALAEMPRKLGEALKIEGGLSWAENRRRYTLGDVLDV